MDCTEPGIAGCDEPFDHKNALLRQPDTAMGPWARVLNGFSLMSTAGVYHGQRASSDEKRVFILSRSSFAGQQRHGAATWSGDINASWQTFARQIPAGVNFCAAGIPLWTTDNGGFYVRGRGGHFPDGVKDPAFAELLLRWTQFSCFCPLMRAHGTQTPRETYQFGRPGDLIYDALKDMTQWRMRLLPYLYSLAHRVWSDHGTLMRPMGMDYPGDTACYDIDDQFLCGPSLLVCPITEPMVSFPQSSITPLDAREITAEHPDFAAAPGFIRTVHDDIDGQNQVHIQRVTHPLDYSWTGDSPAGVTSDGYRVDAARLFTPGNPVSVIAADWNPKGSWFDHGASAWANFIMDGGQRLCYRGSWTATGCQTGWDCSWRIFADRGSITWDGLEGFKAQRVVDMQQSSAEEGGPLVRDLEDVEVPSIDTSDFRAGHDGIIHDFLQCLKEGRNPGTICTDNIHTLNMVLGAIESAESGSVSVSLANRIKELVHE